MRLIVNFDIGYFALEELNGISAWQYMCLKETQDIHYIKKRLLYVGRIVPGYLIVLFWPNL